MFRPEATAECPLPIGSVYSRNGVVLACHDDLQASEWDLNHILMLKEYLGGVAALHKILATGNCSSILGRWLEEQLAPEKLREAQSMIHGGVNEDAAFSTKPIDARNNRIWAIRVRCRVPFFQVSCLFFLFPILTFIFTGTIRLRSRAISDVIPRDDQRPGPTRR